MNRMENPHPGQVLQSEFLIPFGISLIKLANDIKISEKHLFAIVDSKTRITANIALRLSQYFGNSAKFWLGLQDDYDLEEELKIRGRNK